MGSVAAILALGSRRGVAGRNEIDRHFHDWSAEGIWRLNRL